MATDEFAFTSDSCPRYVCGSLLLGHCSTFHARTHNNNKHKNKARSSFPVQLNQLASRNRSTTLICQLNSQVIKLKSSSIKSPMQAQMCPKYALRTGCSPHTRTPRYPTPALSTVTADATLFTETVVWIFFYFHYPKTQSFLITVISVTGRQGAHEKHWRTS